MDQRSAFFTAEASSLFDVKIKKIKGSDNK